MSKLVAGVGQLAGKLSAVLGGQEYADAQLQSYKEKLDKLERIARSLQGSFQKFADAMLAARFVCFALEFCLCRLASVGESPTLLFDLRPFILIRFLDSFVGLISWFS